MKEYIIITQEFADKMASVDITIFDAPVGFVYKDFEGTLLCEKIYAEYFPDEFAQLGELQYKEIPSNVFEYLKTLMHSAI